MDVTDDQNTNSSKACLRDMVVHFVCAKCHEARSESDGNVRPEYYVHPKGMQDPETEETDTTFVVLMRKHV